MVNPVNSPWGDLAIAPHPFYVVRTRANFNLEVTMLSRQDYIPFATPFEHVPMAVEDSDIPCSTTDLAPIIHGRDPDIKVCWAR